MSDVMTEVIVDCTTGEQTIRELTADEIAERETAAAAFAAEQQAKAEAEAEAKAAAEAKLVKLGLTAEDLKALLG